MSICSRPESLLILTQSSPQPCKVQRITMLKRGIPSNRRNRQINKEVNKETPSTALLVSPPNLGSSFF